MSEDEQKGSQKTQDANLKVDDQLAKGESQKTDESGQKAKAGQAEYVPTKDYENLESRFGQSQTELKKSQDEIAELKAKADEHEKFQKQVKDSFSPQPTPTDAQKTLTPTELRIKAKTFRDEGYEDSAVMFEELADNREWRDKVDNNTTTEQQLHNLFGKLSKDDSPIKAESVDWKAVGQIAADKKISAEAAYGTWLSDNYGKLTAEKIEQEKSVWDKANQARGFEGDYDIPVTDAEKKEDEEARAEIGEPGKWPTET